MQFLNKEIEVLVRRKKSKSLVKKQISCGISQEYDSQNEDLEKD
ncbi:hypothetical protein [Flagellimonas aquimarina]|nr:hypothetical protein [Allomuricauda koreensis]